MDKNPFLKRLMKIKNKGEVFHSSAYAQAQSGGSMGAASTESFARRREIDKNRTVVRGYGESSVASSAASNGPRAKAWTQPAKDGVGGGRSRPMPSGMSPSGMPPKNPGISR